jgi:two-component system, OmpR family, sensor kinase
VRPVTLRARVAAASAVAIAVAVALLGVAVLARLDSRLYGALDDTLRRRAVDVARLSASAPAVLTDPGALESRIGGSALLVQVVDRRGRIVARSGGLGSRVLPVTGATAAALHGRRAGFGDARLGDAPLRLYAAPLGEIGDGQAAGGAVLVAGTTTDIEDTLRATRSFVLLGGLAAVLIAAGVAALLTRRALRPLSDLAAGARDVERTGDASQRLAVPATGDEVGDLAATLDAMLASLERAREAERRFVGDASHELRTPLTALRGNVTYALRHGADDAVLADIDDGVRRLGGLLDDLLALAREDAAPAVRAEVVDLAEVAREAAGGDPLGRTTVHAPSRRAVVRGERAALERAAGNLVRNARRHGPAEGAITVTVSAGDGRALLSVADEGDGLTPEEAEHAFERFWRRPDAPVPGSGLGLAIVRSIVERHGGSVRVDGARFTLDLPGARDRDGAHDSLTARA